MDAGTTTKKGLWGKTEEIRIWTSVNNSESIISSLTVTIALHQSKILIRRSEYTLHRNTIPSSFYKKKKSFSILSSTMVPYGALQ